MAVFVSLQLEESLLEGMVEHGPFVLSGPNLLTVAGNLAADPGSVTTYIILKHHPL